MCLRLPAAGMQARPCPTCTSTCCRGGQTTSQRTTRWAAWCTARCVCNVWSQRLKVLCPATALGKNATRPPSAAVQQRWQPWKPCTQHVQAQFLHPRQCARNATAAAAAATVGVHALCARTCPCQRFPPRSSSPHPFLPHPSYNGQRNNLKSGCTARQLPPPGVRRDRQGRGGVRQGGG